MRAWDVLRQVLSAVLCVLLAVPAYSSEKIESHHLGNGGVYPKSRVWGSNEKTLLHFRATLLPSEKQHRGYEKCRWKNVVGSVVTYDYDAFGNLINSTFTGAAPTPNNYLYSGEQFDPDLHLYYNRARYLNTSTGRFWNMDTDEGNDQDPLSLHKYLYGQGDPVNHVDPSGHEIDELIGGIAVGLTIAAIATVVAYTVIQGPRAPNVVGPIAQNNAKLLVISALAAITTGQTNLFARYFGNPATTERMNAVYTNYQNILAYLFHRIEFFKTDQPVFAFVYPNIADQIHLGPYFFKAPWVGIDSKPGTIVHEVSHLTHLTIDQQFGNPPRTAYGEQNAIELAATDPAKAVANADNYEYFAERSNLYGDWGAPAP
jgi:RHS repeat-associated protein